MPPKHQILDHLLSVCEEDRSWASQVAPVVKSPPANEGEEKRLAFDPWVGKIPWRAGMATHSSILAWGTPWTEKPSQLQSRGCKEGGHARETKHRPVHSTQACKPGPETGGCHPSVKKGFLPNADSLILPTHLQKESKSNTPPLLVVPVSAVPHSLWPS